MVSANKHYRRGVRPDLRHRRRLVAGLPRPARRPTSTAVQDERVVVRVADDGPGVPDDAKERVFEKDYTTRGDGTRGFGLYFVAVTVERDGGSVRFEDNHPRGTVVVIELPRPHDMPDDGTDGTEPLDATRPRRTRLEGSSPDPTDS